MAITENKNKVSSLAKDFGMQSKDIIAILKDYTEAPKGHSQVLSDRELSIVFDYLTLHHQVKIETIFAETYTEKKEEPKAAPAPAASAPKAAPAYQKLVQMGDMLIGLIRRSKGRDNKSLAAFAEAISKIINKFEF